MKLTIVGGGGFRVPLVYGALLEKARAARPRRGRPARHRRRPPGAHRPRCSTGSPPSTASRLPFRATTDLVDAVEGADFVFCAIRVGQLEGRVVDEDVPLGLGVLGQETTGPGGICFALRTIPVMVRLAETIAQHAPKAWLINFTNPAGMVTEAVQQVLGDRAVGICDSPSGLCRRVAAALGRDPATCGSTTSGSTTSAGSSGVRDPAARELLDGLLDDDARLAGFEEGRLFGGEWLRSLGMIPNEYLYYFYYAADTVDAIRSSSALARRVPARAAARVLRAERAAAAERSRPGARRATTASAPTWPRRATRRATRHEHEADENGGYENEAMAVLEAIALNTPRGADPQHRQPLEPAVPGRARGGRGALRRRPRRPGAVAMGEVPAHARALVETMKDVERTTIDAALTGSRELAVKALALHPLVPSVTTRARDLRRLPRAAARARGGVPVSVDLACGEPAFLDLTFAGLDAMPGPGEERLARDFLRSPGGGAITAVGAARLGLRARWCRRWATMLARCSPPAAFRTASGARECFSPVSRCSVCRASRVG